MAKYGGVSLEKDVTYYAGEHEIFLVFNNDDDAGWFDDWWVLRGENLFRAWVSEQEDI